MQRVAMTTQGTDADAVVGENPLKLGEGRSVFQHRELAMRIAHVVPRGKFHGINMQFRKFLENHA
jgi:hypothetical protein